MKKKLDYQWVIVITCFIMEFVALGFCSSNKSLYLGAITEALNIKRSLFSINDSVRFMTSAVVNLFFGTLIHKFGARKMVAWALSASSALCRSMLTRKAFSFSTSAVVCWVWALPSAPRL